MRWSVEFSSVQFRSDGGIQFRGGVRAAAVVQVLPQVRVDPVVEASPQQQLVSEARRVDVQWKHLHGQHTSQQAVRARRHVQKGITTHRPPHYYTIQCRAFKKGKTIFYFVFSQNQSALSTLIPIG